MNEALFRFILGQVAILGSAWMGIWGALRAWKMHLDEKLEEVKIKARENSVGATAIAEIKEDVKALAEDAKDIRKDFSERHNDLSKQLTEGLTRLVGLLNK